MSHRNSLYKTNASERTKRRWRERHNQMTVVDVERKSWFESLKEKILNDKAEREVLKHG